MPRKRGALSFFTKIAGVTYENEDGTSRQDIIRRHCDPGDALILSPEPDNAFSDNAVAVYVAKKGWFGGLKAYQIGYLPEHSGVAQQVFDYTEGGGTGGAWIEKITGGTDDKPTLGVNIEITLDGDE